MGTADTQCLVAAAENAAAKRIDAKTDKAENSFDWLKAEFEYAFKHDAQILISTPGFAKKEMSLADVVADSFAGFDGDHVLHQLLSIVSQAAQGKDMHMVAAAWIKAQAITHAKFHCGEVA